MYFLQLQSITIVNVTLLLFLQYGRTDLKYFLIHQGPFIYTLKYDEKIINLILD